MGRTGEYVHTQDVRDAGSGMSSCDLDSLEVWLPAWSDPACIAGT